MDEYIIEETTKVVDYFTNKICSCKNIVSILFFGLLTLIIVVPTILLTILYHWIAYPMYMAKKVRNANVSLKRLATLSKEEKAECEILGNSQNNLR